MKKKMNDKTINSIDYWAEEKSIIIKLWPSETCWGS